MITRTGSLNFQFKYKKYFVNKQEATAENFTPSHSKKNVTCNFKQPIKVQLIRKNVKVKHL